MVWNTIAYPKMMVDDNPGGLGITRTYSPIKFADTHKLSFYDIVVSMTGTVDDKQLVLVKGDFETIKKMLLNDEVICGAFFMHVHNDEIADLARQEFAEVSYSYYFNTITLLVDGDSDNPIYLLSDNTISTTEPNGEDIELNPTPSNPGALG